MIWSLDVNLSSMTTLRYFSLFNKLSQNYLTSYHISHSISFTSYFSKVKSINNNRASKESSYLCFQEDNPTPNRIAKFFLLRHKNRDSVHMTVCFLCLIVSVMSKDFLCFIFIHHYNSKCLNKLPSFIIQKKCNILQSLDQPSDFEKEKKYKFTYPAIVFFTSFFAKESAMLSKFWKEEKQSSL